MIRVAIIFLAAVVAFALLRMLLSQRNVSNRLFGIVYVSVLAGALLLYLGLTGKLHWLFALLGAALPFIMRGLPLLLQLFSLRSFVGRMRQGPAVGSARTGQTSSIKTRYVDMSLDHDSGHMDGRVLLGVFAGKQLSELDLNALLSLLQTAREDGDSERVLRAYLDRTHPDWDESTQENKGSSQAGDVDVREAYEILGLTPGASRAEIIDAHRKLMQKVHPDHGGSTYLAARINDAKAVLLDNLGP